MKQIHQYTEWLNRKGRNPTAKGVMQGQMAESLPGHHGTTEMPDKLLLQILRQDCKNPLQLRGMDVYIPPG